MKPILACLPLALLACGGEPSRRVQAGDVSFLVPDAWIQRTAGAMRLATFKIPPFPGDQEAAELTVSQFGGSVQDNLARWQSQFEPADGASLEEVRQIETKRVSPMNVTILRLSGTYVAPITPMNPDERHQKPGQRLFGAIAEPPEGGLYFFKIVGPEKSMRKWEPAFETMIDSLSWRPAR